MCLLLIANQIHPDHKLIIAANRDEFYNRPTAKADFWKEDSQLLAGRDLEAGGAWLGITKSGRLSAITNYRDFHNPLNENAPSRGGLTTGFLLGKISPKKYSENLLRNGAAFNGFNLIYGIDTDLYYFSNQTNVVIKLPKGLFGLSNALLDTAWPKVTESKKFISELISANKISTQGLFEILADTNTADDELLPDTGIGLERERVLSSNFIISPQYGTRCSTVILIDNNDKAIFTERTFEQGSEEFSEVNFEFNLE